jgi:hypothetical protein
LVRAALCLAPVLGSASETESEELVKALLRPTGWSAEWIGPGGSGLTEVTFERRGDNLIAKIKLLSPFELSCENPVTVERNALTFDGCRDPSVTLVYDPSDSAYPLKGRSPRGYVWKVKAK